MRLLHRHTLRLTPRVAAFVAALIGVINVASALTPGIRWRGHLLLDFEPVEAVRLFHAFALPTGLALLLVAPYLAKRRLRAWRVAVVLMLLLGGLDLLKGLDFEETLITWGMAAVLIRSQSAFTVDHDELTLRSAVVAGSAAGRDRAGGDRAGRLGLGGPSLGQLGGARDR